MASAPSRTALAQSDASARDRGADHGAEDFGGHDDRLGVLTSQLDAALGGQRDLFQRALDGHIATCDHDAVERLDDLLEVLEGLRLLDLGDDRDTAAFLVHDLMGAIDVGGEAHEGHGNDVGAGADGPAQILFVLLGQSRQRHGDARKVDALVAGDRSGNDNLGVHVVAFDLGDLEADLAVVDEDRIACMAVARETLEGGGGDVLVAFDVISGDDELLAFGQLDLVLAVGVLLEPTAADLRTLQVNQGCDVAASGLGGGTEVVVDLEVVFRSAVGAVQTSDVHTCFDKAGDAFQGLGSGTDGIYDLGFTHECLPILVDIDFGSDDPVSNGIAY